MNSKALIVISLLGVSLGYIFFNSQKIKDLSQTEISTTLIQELPEMKVVDLAAKEAFLSDFYKPDKNLLLVHFWGSWCGPCETEFPSFIRLIESFKGSKTAFVLVAVSDKPSEIKKFLDKNPIPSNAIIVLDQNDQYLAKFGAAKVPETFVFNESRKLVKHFLGPQDWSLPYMTDLFRKSFK